MSDEQPPGSAGPNPILPADGPRLQVSIVADPCLNLAMQQNHVLLVKEVALENPTDRAFTDVCVRLVAEPEFASPLELRVESIAPRGRQIWSTVPQVLSPSFLAGLTKRLDGVVHVHVSCREQAAFVEHRAVKVLAYDQWGGLQSLPELLAAFVLPNHPALVPWLRRAASLLAKWTGDPSLSGYQARSRDRVAKVAQAVFHSIQESGVTYVEPPASFEATGQRVRTAERIEEEKLGTCLDLALLAASCLEQSGLHPLVVFVRGHAVAGVWLDETTFAEPALEDGALLLKRIQLGELILFDPTLATHRPAATFEQSVVAALRSLSTHPFECVVDVARSRKGGIVPLPLRRHGVELDPGPADATVRAPDAAPDLVLPRAAPSEPVAETPASRLERWKRRLLDLSNRNRLLHFVERKKTVGFVSHDLARIEDLLSAGAALTLRKPLPEMSASGADGRPLPPDVIERLVAVELDGNRLVTRLEEEELSARSTEIFRAARQGLEEGGASGLYVALGFLEWYESPTSDVRRLAPLILVPVELQRGSIRAGFKLVRAADETRFNTTLLQKLSDDFNLDLSGLDPLPEDENGIDVEGVLQLVTAAVRDVPRWRVLHEAQLGFFTFAKFLMWKDIDQHSEQLLQNPLVSHLVEHPERVFDSDWKDPAAEDLDAAHPTAELQCPVLADSSQLAAVVAAAGGKSFVLEGPPGTGKSQTITNLIAHCLASGKTVLFVSEKTAALNVVFDRLKRIGLERFCLELHSNKANKLEVVRRLGEALNGQREASPPDWSMLAGRLDRVRQELNAYARAVGREHEVGLSVYRATSLLTALRELPCVVLGWGDVATVDRERLERCRSLLREARHTVTAIGEPREHALAGVGITEVAAETPAEIRKSFLDLRRELERIHGPAGIAAGALSIELAQATLGELRLTAIAARAALDAPDVGREMLTSDLVEADRLITEFCKLGTARDAARAVIDRDFERKLCDLDVKDLQRRAREARSSWLLPRFFKTRSLRRALAVATRPGTKPTLATLSEAIDRAVELAELAPRLAALAATLLERTRCAWNGEDFDPAGPRSALTWCQGVAAEVASSSGPNEAPKWLDRVASFVGEIRRTANSRVNLQECKAAFDRLFGAAGAVAAVLKLDAGDPWSSLTEGAALPGWRRRIDRIEAALPQLRNWALWRRRRADLVAARLESVVAALERGDVRGEQLVEAFDRAFYEAWLSAARAADPSLHDFLSLSHEERIAEFRSLDEQCTQATRKVVAAKLSSRMPSGASESVPNSELGILKRQLQLQRRHLGPRQLLQQTKSLVQRLKPCFLMSPISVAQYLPPGAFRFDLVVFDEASQIPTWDAVGAIARGRQAVVVGDSKQLPPTSFFEVSMEDEDAEPLETEELESILNECRAANVPAMDLRWHYRSRHETLIAFSNRKYYQNRLHTFPSAQFQGLGVQWRLVPDGVYDKGRSRTNRVEAVALVTEVLRRLRDPELSKASIGVVTFSSAQQTMVEDLLDEAREADPSLDRHFVASPEVPEPVFVKNLENVQGDERDVILFSICYGPDAEGRISMNFGPLNQQGGERRLNVAVTRARRELMVFSSIRGDQIDTNRTRARGVADLKAFLEYAERGLGALPAETTPQESDDFDFPLEQAIGEALRAKGHDVHAQVGCSGYRVDLAVVDAERRGRYLLGIECDGRNYHSARTARERDRLRQEVLEDLGWRLVRVWSSDWWEMPGEQLERLCRAISEARASEPPPRSTPSPEPAGATNPASDATNPASEPAAIAEPEVDSSKRYRARASARLGSQSDFYDGSQSSRIEQELAAVVEEEGPITLELAASRVARAFELGRTTQRVLDRVDELARRAKLQRTSSSGRVVLWPAALDPANWRGFRPSAPGDPDARDADDLPVEEIANAAAHLLRANGACPRRDLQRALSRLFGFRSLGSSVSKHLDAGIQHLVERGAARVGADGRVDPTG